LIDTSIIGNNDKIMAHALVGKIEEYIPKGIHSNIRDNAKDWSKKSVSVLKNGVGFVPGDINVSYNGRQLDFEDKWDILINN